MTDDAARDLSIARAAIGATRHNLAIQVSRVAELGAPSRLAAVGTEAAREAAVAKARKLGQRALGVAATRATRGGVGGVVAGAVVPLAYLLLRRRRRRRELPRRGSRLASVLRLGRSPLAGVLFSALSVLARRR
jgi:hypothetical protein